MIKIFSLESKKEVIIVIASLVAMALHFILKLTNSDFVSTSPLLLNIIFGGFPLLFQIIRKIFNKDLGADLLAFIALLVAIWVGEYLAANLIILMLASGQALEEYATKRASFALEALAKRMPSIVHRRLKNSSGKKIEDVKIEQVAIGDLIEVYPHETCPVDGEVVEGYGTMDESYLTGEPYQLKKAPGSSVLSGAINGNAALTIRAEKIAQDSRYAKIINVMKDAEQHRPKLRRIADQVGAIFAPLSLIFAFATFYFTGDVLKFLSVLVIATPCPILIAIPVVIISAISIAAKNSIIIKDPTVLERLSTCSTAIFDKTGTLTYGKPELTQIITQNNFERHDVLQLAASLERYSRHPLATSILKAAAAENIVLLDTEDLNEKPGKGLTGHINQREITITSRNKISESHADQLKNLPSFESGLECVILINNKIAAIFNFRDTPRLESKTFINHLAPEHNFKKIIMLSGDRSSEVEYLSSLLGIKHCYSSQSPEQKLAIVRSETAKAPTLFMGDGINDAPALAAATIGIAFGESNDVTSESAGAVIMEHSLIKVDELIHISESMRKIALQSAVGGMLFSIAGMGLAAAGYISPVNGALLQQIIDAAAILNALRLTWGSSIKSDIENK